jgi:hypothetical protein
MRDRPHADVDEATARIRGRRSVDAVGGDTQNGDPVVPRVLAARRDPPAYLLGELGERPLDAMRAAAWDRAAMLIDRYRVEHGVSVGDDAFGPRPPDLAGQVAWRNVRHDVERARRQLAGRVASRGAEQAL